jgi:hypothetical protein
MQEYHEKQALSKGVKCPKCGKGFMKAIPNIVPLTEVVKMNPKLAQCTACNYQDDYGRFYPISEKIDK